MPDGSRPVRIDGPLKEELSNRLSECHNALLGIQNPAEAIEAARKALEEARNVMWLLRLHCPKGSPDQQECMRMCKQMEKSLASLTPSQEQPL